MKGHVVLPYKNGVLRFASHFHIRKCSLSGPVQNFVEYTLDNGIVPLKLQEAQAVFTEVVSLNERYMKAEKLALFTLLSDKFNF